MKSSSDCISISADFVITKPPVASSAAVSLANARAVLKIKMAVHAQAIVLATEKDTLGWLVISSLTPAAGDFPQAEQRFVGKALGKICMLTSYPLAEEPLANSPVLRSSRIYLGPSSPRLPSLPRN